MLQIKTITNQNRNVLLFQFHAIKITYGINKFIQFKNSDVILDSNMASTVILP